VLCSNYETGILKIKTERLWSFKHPFLFRADVSAAQIKQRKKITANAPIMAFARQNGLFLT